MKKSFFLVLTILCITALLVWFSCNPFHVNGKGESSNFSVLDESNGNRFIITTTMIVNGSTYDGGGAHITPENVYTVYDGQDWPPIIEVTNGTLKNAIIDAPAGLGIFLSGNCSVDNISIPDVGENAITAKKPGTYSITNSTFNNSEDRIIQINDLCTITAQNINVNGASKFMRQNGGKTWKMTSYSIDCTLMNMRECIFRSDSSTSTFFYRNLTSNCATIGYLAGLNGVVTKAVPY